MKTAKILLYFMVIISEEMKHFVRASRLLEQKKKKRVESKHEILHTFGLGWKGNANNIY